jgi:hypothetical protein
VSRIRDHGCSQCGPISAEASGEFLREVHSIAHGTTVAAREHSTSTLERFDNQPS